MCKKNDELTLDKAIEVMNFTETAIRMLKNQIREEFDLTESQIEKVFYTTVSKIYKGGRRRKNKGITE